MTYQEIAKIMGKLVDAIEYEELQKEWARKINFENSLKSGVIYGFFILGYVLLLCSGFLVMTLAMILGAFALIFAYGIENFLLRPKLRKGRENENRN